MEKGASEMGVALESGDDDKKSKKVFSKKYFGGNGEREGDGNGESDGVLRCRFFHAAASKHTILKMK